MLRRSHKPEAKEGRAPLRDTFQVPNGVTVPHVTWTALSGFGSMVEWIVHA